MHVAHPHQRLAYQLLSVRWSSGEFIRMAGSSGFVSPKLAENALFKVTMLDNLQIWPLVFLPKPSQLGSPALPEILLFFRRQHFDWFAHGLSMAPAGFLRDPDARCTQKHSKT